MSWCVFKWPVFFSSWTLHFNFFHTSCGSIVYLWASSDFLSLSRSLKKDSESIKLRSQGKRLTTCGVYTNNMYIHMFRLNENVKKSCHSIRPIKTSRAPISTCISTVWACLSIECETYTFTHTYTEVHDVVHFRWYCLAGKSVIKNRREVKKSKSGSWHSRWFWYFLFDSTH